MSLRRLALPALVLLAAGLLFALLQAQRTAPAGVPVAGGDGGGLPRATPAEEGIDATGLERAVQLADSLPARALLVIRHGHLVFEHYRGGASAYDLVDGGPFSEVLVALLAGIAQRERGLELPAGAFDRATLAPAIVAATGMSFADYLSRSLWQPLNAAPARWTPAAGVEGCCLAARATDWLRVAALLMGGGRFEGTQVLDPTWLARIGTPAPGDEGRGYGLWLAPAAEGAEPFAAVHVLFLRGPGRTRLWMAPALELAVLMVDDPSQSGQDARGDAPGGAQAFDETRVPNAVFRAVAAPTAASANGLDALVPGH
jgi:CubicO group peptidase (beta-lactamase class C family)